MGAPDNGIPKELIEKAQAIAVFPGVLKAAFIFGGREGKGVISRRTAQGWTTPAFFNLGGGSFGAQIGANKTDYVLLIMNEKGLNGLLGNKFEIGGEVGVGGRTCWARGKRGDGRSTQRRNPNLFAQQGTIRGCRSEGHSYHSG